VTARLPALAVLLPVALAACAVALSGSPPLRFLALGDSYTIGEGVGAAHRWPSQLAALLRAEGLAVGAAEIVARTGWTTAELAAGIDAASPEGPYDLVSLQIGVNNQYRGLALADYRAELAALLERAIGLAGGDPGRVVVLSIPDWGITPFAASYDRPRIAAEIDAFNEVARAEAESRGAAFVDVTPLSRLAADDPGLLVGDGLHPSGAMYAEWARLVLPPAIDALRP
jgi:lysophospholipase L1-like esterase